MVYVLIDIILTHIRQRAHCILSSSTVIEKQHANNLDVTIQVQLRPSLVLVALTKIQSSITMNPLTRMEEASTQSKRSSLPSNNP